MSMNHLFRWGQSAMAIVAVTLASTSFAPSAQAQGISGQCRAIKQQTAVFKDRSSTSAALVILKADAKVTLAEDAAQDGLIAVSAPTKGFVQTANLKMCPGKPPVKPVEGSCRVVTQKLGLIVRKEPMSADVVGGVAMNEKITLASPAEMKEASDGRTWVKIVKPLEGWVSEGFTGAPFKNFEACK
ncbi:hypothetical protein [Alkalinema sp. FACHB-956]|uniref:hypothetical protein n=1 Tax=Alkalinema sp. FACHB-956 TaxID=2692768 RepID=UPI0016897832|nr:hypothetical protein [Alkalinema sp. FACHB-956]MBD2328335.1 hypothetical protein [Alkalinema sp. FACHB-956]